MPRPLAAALALLPLCCSPSPGDPRIASPQATVRTLLEATRLLGASPGGLANPFGRVREAGPLRPPPDAATLALCIWDFDRDDPTSRAMADFVAGMLAAMQDRLVYRIGGRRATVETGLRVVVMRRSGEGWHIVLAESVPPEIREGIARAPRSGAAGGSTREQP